MERDEIVDQLNDLIRITEDSHLSLQRAAEDCTDEELKTLFNDLSAERAAIVRDLQIQVASIGGAPEATGTLMGGAHRLITGVKAVLGARTCEAILQEVGDVEAGTLARFDQAIAGDLPPEVAEALAGLARRIGASLERLRGQSSQAA
ncbi:MAG TPA: PA2169 family four-helix-bundle protein [Azospirillaceae bacterium]|nr:PA2169 family four-helix-bundle protein [Azospirillaceae bacterium]